MSDDVHEALNVRESSVVAGNSGGESLAFNRMRKPSLIRTLFWTGILASCVGALIVIDRSHGELSDVQAATLIVGLVAAVIGSHSLIRYLARSAWLALLVFMAALVAFGHGLSTGSSISGLGGWPLVRSLRSALC